MPFGLRVNTLVERPDADLVARFRDVPATNLSDVMRGAGTVDPQIRSVFSPVARIAGPAITVSVPYASVYMVKMAFQLAQPGDVVIVNGRGNMATSLVGGNMLRGLLHRGISAFLLDGAVRDVSEIREDGLPVFARGVGTATGPTGPDVGEVNFPIAFGGAVVNPGDIVVADENGIVVVPREIAEEVLADAHALQARHDASQPQLLAGEVTNIAAIEQKLRDDGFEFVEVSHTRSI